MLDCVRLACFSNPRFGPVVRLDGLDGVGVGVQLIVHIFAMRSEVRLKSSIELDVQFTSVHLIMILFTLLQQIGLHGRV